MSYNNAQKNNQVKYLDIGRMDYEQAWKYQEDLFQQVVAIKTTNRKENKADPTDNFLVICEHPHTYTLGKSGTEDNLLIDKAQLDAIDAKFYKINRGGDITYHGPGQIVGYPIFDLENFFTDIHKYLRFLEEIIIRTLADFGIKGERFEGYTGVWLDVGTPDKERKICAMGVRASRWVTMHGFALNVNADVDYFDKMIPCGIPDKKVTSMHLELGNEVDESHVKERIRHHFTEVFGLRWN